MASPLVSYKDPAAPALFTDSLYRTGFGVVRDHPIPQALVEEVYAEWLDFFNGDDGNGVTRRSAGGSQHPLVADTPEPSSCCKYCNKSASVAMAHTRKPSCWRTYCTALWFTSWPFSVTSILNLYI